MSELVQGGGLKILCVQSLAGSNPASSIFANDLKISFSFFFLQTAFYYCYLLKSLFLEVISYAPKIIFIGSTGNKSSEYKDWD